ncbi:segregation and condensation protein A [Dethiothermospora halolimnae]|uniref:segregation and condensation protein A n=1 Tax=Dethiothermospora halolimnae TaxID=3114390 RepID=UPI003CCBE1E6
MGYKVILESFEGPFDLLYHLIEKSEIDIYDIPIAEITEQYISYIEKMKELDLDVTSEFLLMVATLLEIKSRMLLPKMKKDDGEQLQMEEVDPREELIRRLIEYKKYKNVAEELKTKEKAQQKVYYKPKEEIEMFVEKDEIKLENVNLDDIIDAMVKIIEEKKKDNKTLNIATIERDEITIEQGMKNLLNTLNKKREIEFKKLFQDKFNKVEIVVTFLAILELIKQKKINIVQENNFDSILISIKEPRTSS